MVRLRSKLVGKRNLQGKIKMLIELRYWYPKTDQGQTKDEKRCRTIVLLRKLTKCEVPLSLTLVLISAIMAFSSLVQG